MLREQDDLTGNQRPTTFDHSDPAWMERLWYTGHPSAGGEVKLFTAHDQWDLIDPAKRRTVRTLADQLIEVTDGDEVWLRHRRIRRGQGLRVVRGRAEASEDLIENQPNNSETSMRQKPARWIRLALATSLALCALPAAALNILLCNDDGITAANLRALEQRLTAAGHSVIASAPADNQSGTGGAMSFLRAVPPLTGKERGAVDLGLAAGAPGIGRVGSEGELYYVNGSPVMACLYGLDVVAARKWPAAPDLVISGPNEGNNTGMVNTSSGTFSNLLYAVNRGLPAVAVSHASGRQVKWQADLPSSALAFEIAEATVRLVAALEAGRLKDSPLMQPGLGLNINIPLVSDGAIKDLPFRMTRLGTATDYGAVFYEKLVAHPLAAARGVKDGDAGIGIVKGGAALPNGRRYPKDDHPDSENNVLEQRNAITLSPVEGMPEAPAAWTDALRAQLGGLFKSGR